jgi:hypothetical protein
MTLSRSVPLWLIIPIAVALSATIGWLDYHAGEVQGTVLVLLVVTGVLAFAAPNAAWIVALIMGLSVSGTYLVGRTLNIPPTYPVSAPWSTLIALIPAAIGAACGAAARVALRTALPR